MSIAKNAMFEPPASPCSLASEDKPADAISIPEKELSLIARNGRKAPRGVSLGSILPDGVKRVRRKKSLGLDFDGLSVESHPSPRKRMRKIGPRQKRRDKGIKNNTNMVFVSARGSETKSDFIDHLNISAADERRKVLLQRLRMIDAKKAKLASTACESSSPAAEVRSATSETRAPAIPALDISSITHQSSVEDMERIGARLRGFASTSSPHNVTSMNAASPALSESSQDGLRRRASRSRTPSVLLRGLPGETQRVYKPPGVTQCKRLNFCKKLVNEMLRVAVARPFSAPVNELWPPESIPRYFDVITRPMDLHTIKRKLEAGEYLRREKGLSPHELFYVTAFEDDVKLVFRNAMIYNSAGDILYESAKQLLQGFELDMLKLPAVEKRSVKPSKKKPRGATKGSPMTSRSRKAPSPRTKKVIKRAMTKNLVMATSPLTPQAPLLTTMTLRQLKEHVAELRKHRNYLELAIASPMTGNSRGYSHVALLYALEMTAEEKAELTENIAKLPVDKVDKLVALIKNSGQQGLVVGQEGELEMDIDQFDNKLLRDLELYVESVLGLAKKENDKKPRLETQYHSIEEVDSAIKAAEDRMLEIRSSGAASKKKERSFYDMQDSSSDSGSESEADSCGSSSESDESDSE